MIVLPLIIRNSPHGPQHRRIAALFLLALLALEPARAFQSEHPLTGRKIAPVTNVSGSDWMERRDREREENPEGALDAIGVSPGMVAAEIGAGTGYFTLRMARRVGPSGMIYAEDIQPELLRMLRRSARDEKLANIHTVLGSEADPKLPPMKFDLILMADVYHELSQPQKMLRLLHAALKPGGRLVIIEYRKEDPGLPIRPEHRISIQEAKTEVEAEGFHTAQVLETLPRQHIFVFTP